MYGEDGFVPSHYVERIQNQMFSPSEPIMENDVNSDIVNETKEAKSDPPVEVVNRAHDSVSREEARSSSPEQGQRFSSVLKLVTNAFGKSNKVCISWA